jgi:hypothetical protein
MKSMDESKTESEKGKIVSLDVERNKRKSEDGRIYNLAVMYMNREEENGPFYASMWLYRELHLQGANVQGDFIKIADKIMELKKDPEPPGVA